MADYIELPQDCHTARYLTSSKQLFGRKHRKQRHNRYFKNLIIAEQSF